MRSVKLAGAAVLLLTASCAVRIGSDNGGSQPSQPSRPQARNAPPPPPPPPAAHPAATPAVVHPAQASAIAPAGPSPALNVVKVQAIKARNPKPCGYMEVSPGNWVHIDCEKYTASSRAIVHLSPKKLHLVKTHKTLIRPITKSLRGSRIHVTPPPGTAGATATGAATPTGGPAQVGENFPATVDHRAENVEGPIKNQGGVGSCTAHSLSATLDNAAIRAGKLTPGDHNAMSSPLHVWSRYGLPNMGAAADGNIAQPVAMYSVWPQNDSEACQLFQAGGGYADDCAETYGVKAGTWRQNPTIMAKYTKSEAEGLYKIASIEKLGVSPPDMDELQSILASGADIWSAFLIDGYAWSNSKMKAGVIPDWSDKNGGHAVVISGYRDTPSGKQFLIHNSWGESWGEKGYAWISAAMVNKWLYFAYKVKITNGVKKEDLTDDDCAPDELVDLGTGLCTVMCEAAEPRPNNGCKK